MKTTTTTTRELREEEERRLRGEALNRFIQQQADAVSDAIGNALVLAGGLIFAALCLFSAIMGWQ